jgi:diaminohydroxyphosphoribosylaminopyrimidine deaminase/5-amino-6-(5-phosphoribosylamino)uracil reductase
MTAPTAADYQWMALAIELSRQCLPSPSAYSVGAVIVDEHGRQLARGYSRDSDPRVHAEESALARLTEAGPALLTATLYSTLEPCTQRVSRPRSCTELILAAGIGRVVIAWREPGLFVADCQGFERLTASGVTVVELPALADRARAVNAHLRVSS